jgi:predicted membrane channel-forming protein YqfA (hemolysin III family)
MEYRPTWRKPAGMIFMLLIIALWAVLIASFSNEIGSWPNAVQIPFYIVAGIIWIFPMKPLLRWMETGRFR